MESAEYWASRPAGGAVDVFFPVEGTDMRVVRVGLSRCYHMYTTHDGRVEHRVEAREPEPRRVRVELIRVLGSDAGLGGCPLAGPASTAVAPRDQSPLPPSPWVVPQ